MVSSFSRNASGTSVGTINIDTSGIALSSGAAAGGLLGSSLGVSTAMGTGGASGAAGGLYASDSILAFTLTGTTSSSDLTALSVAIDTAISNVTKARRYARRLPDQHQQSVKLRVVALGCHHIGRWFARRCRHERRLDAASGPARPSNSSAFSRCRSPTRTAQLILKLFNG